MQATGTRRARTEPCEGGDQRGDGAGDDGVQRVCEEAAHDRLGQHRQRQEHRHAAEAYIMLLQGRAEGNTPILQMEVHINDMGTDI